MSDLSDWPPIEGPDEYCVARDGPEVEIKVKASRFVGQVFGRADEAGLREGLEGVRRRYHDARHHCWATRIGAGDACVTASDDDGEPTHTAGPPILQVLQAEDLSDGLIVVTRWFGGTKLGTGGLIRAYGDCAREAAAVAPRETVARDLAFGVAVDYGDVGAIEAVLARAADEVSEVARNFTARAEFDLRVRRSRARGLAAALIEATAARACVIPPGIS